MVTAFPQSSEATEESHGQNEFRWDDSPKDAEIEKSDGKTTSAIWMSFDIETSPQADEHIEQFFELPEPPPHPGEFNSAAVKLGRMTDPAKIDAKIQSAKEAHEQDCLQYEQKCKQAISDAMDKLKSKAALDPVLGRVVAIGATTKSSCGKLAPQIIGRSTTDEVMILSDFWRIAEIMIQDGVPMIGHGIHRFDLPFMVNRSRILGVPLPVGIMTGAGRKYWNSLFIDIATEWEFGNPNGYIKLDKLAKAFGLPGKMDGDVTGENFHKYWLSDKEEYRDMAIAYLMRDIELPGEIAERMGVV